MASHLFLVAGDVGWQARRNPVPAALAGLTAALDDPGTDLQAVLVERGCRSPTGSIDSPTHSWEIRTVTPSGRRLNSKAMRRLAVKRIPAAVSAGLRVS